MTKDKPGVVGTDGKIDPRRVRRSMVKMCICAELDSLPKRDRAQIVRELFTTYVEDEGLTRR